MLGITPAYRSNSSAGVAQSKPITATLGPSLTIVLSGGYPWNERLPRRPGGHSIESLRAFPGASTPPFIISAVVAILRRVLYLDALRSALAGAILIAFPRMLLVDMFDQLPVPDYGFVRILGVASIAMAMLMVLVAHRVEEVWWWSWAFAVLEIGRAVVATVNAVFGLPQGGGALLWWLIAGVSLVFTAGLLWGLARAGVERRP